MATRTKSKFKFPLFKKFFVGNVIEQVDSEIYRHGKGVCIAKKSFTVNSL